MILHLQEAIAAAKRWGLDGVVQQSPQNGHGWLGWCGEEPKVHEHSWRGPESYYLGPGEPNPDWRRSLRRVEDQDEP